ncbi:NAD(P)/FAD-dependent oxidoreductase [uncultured Methanoregula sp.]|uniref:NAD(P)/FAD-dependent oxidoreductase n=1 Tax=uncultured Methanoregula sp. TaxID=1005933 RepID=UPI002AAC34DE|nr:NAD(P)/FAD-dependent oxidoreductase [uncultured Methanoregula sp.]
MRIGIIGGGLTGLVAAHVLGQDHEVDLYEKLPYLGGCLSSYNMENYWIERYYHHCFSGDTALFSLMTELNLSSKLEWMNGTTGYYARNAIYPLNTPVQILKYPELTILDKARLAYLVLTAKKADLKTLDQIPADQFIIEHLGWNNYTSFFEPLLKSKFGDRRKEVSAAWLMSRIAIRSNRGVAGEQLGYLNGGFHQLIAALESSIVQKGGTIRKQTPVSTLSRSGNNWMVNDTRYDLVISTIPPQELGRMGGPALPPIPYQGAACLTLALDREVTKGIYWLNMKDSAPYGAVVSHTNFIPSVRYGEHIIYLASYFSGAVLPQLDERMMADFCSRFGVSKQEIHWHRMAVDPWAGPVYTTGYGSLIPEYEQSGLFMAGMFSKTNYPERSMEGSVRAGLDIAACIEKRNSHE